MRGGRQEGGFALVATLSVMVILVMVSLAMLSLASIELRTSQSGAAWREAQANARMALMLALGDLQRHAGLDQRVTAEADILTGGGFAGWDASPDKRHYVGVFSTENWHERTPDGLRNNQKRYDKNRNREAFLGWLVSGEKGQVESLDHARTPVIEAESVAILGAGSAGSDPIGHVRVPKLGITGPSGEISGKIAWWVSDQGVKAKVNLPTSRPPAASPWGNRLALAGPATLGISQIDGFGGFDPANVPAEEIDRLVTRNQLSLLGGNPVSAADLKARYHDVTAHGHGVLADVALGGLRRDLSLPFELPILKPPAAGDWDYALNQDDGAGKQDEDFTSIREFSSSGDRNSAWVSVYWSPGYRADWWANRLGYCFMLRDPRGGSDAMGFKRYLRGPTWQSLRNHYRSYKRDHEGLPASDASRRGWPTPSDGRTWLAQAYQPYSHWHNSMGEHLLSTTYVGGRDSADTLLSPDLFDPFYRFGSNNGRPWNTLGHDSLGRAPVFTRIALVLSHRSRPLSGNRRLELVMNAVGNIWNPYNVPIEFEAAFVHLDLKGLKWNFTRRKADGTETELAVDPEQRSFGREKHFPFQNFRFGVTAEQDPAYPFGTTRPTKLIRLNPGEIRTFALNMPQPRAYSWADMTSVPGSFTNNWEGGMSLTFSNQWQVFPGDKYKFEMFPQQDGKLRMETYMGYFENSRGEFMNPFAGTRQGTGFRDLPELSSLHITNAADILPPGGKVEKLLSAFTDDQEAICYLEFRRRASDQSPQGVLAQFDPRSIVNHSDSMGPGEKGSVPDNWDVIFRPVSDFDLMQAGIGVRNNGFWGNSHEGNGQTQVVAFDVPDAPLTGIAGFQHLQTGPNGWDVSYAIGNSFPHPAVPQDELFSQVGSTNPSYRTTFYDMSYLANQGLWDGYFFSGIQLPGGDSGDLAAAEKVMKAFLDPALPNPLHNRRLVATELPPNTSESLRIRELTNYRRMARHLMLDGAMNINSTRVEAWKAWLSGTRDREVDLVGRTGELSSPGGRGTPFVRCQVSGGGDGEEWRGYIRPSDPEIATLAENIVRQVKKRGPFLSVADFVNRRLAADETGEMGALQAALVESGLDTGSGSEIGIPGTIRQGDILNSIGSTISARSDTFVIRSYGEVLAKDGSSRILARAWCEAVVQRMPTLVEDNGELLKKPNPGHPGTDPAGTDPFIANDAAPDHPFGREFRIISLRWLNPGEV